MENLNETDGEYYNFHKTGITMHDVELYRAEACCIECSWSLDKLHYILP